MSKIKEGTYIETVYGDMVDPITGKSYDKRGTKLQAPSTWIDAQVSAGKMKAEGYSAQVAAPAEPLKPVKTEEELKAEAKKEASKEAPKETSKEAPKEASKEASKEAAK